MHSPPTTRYEDVSGYYADGKEMIVKVQWLLYSSFGLYVIADGAIALSLSYILLRRR